MAAAPAWAEVRGKAFQLAGTVGVAPWDKKLGLKPCVWFGAQMGHRFEPIAERFHFGVRAGWEGCVAAQDTAAASRIDMILVDFAFITGVKLAEPLFFYGLTGAGMMIGDATPSGGRLIPRTVFQGGVGLDILLGRYLLLEVELRGLTFENFNWGDFGGLAGNAGGPLFTFSVGGQI